MGLVTITTPNDGETADAADVATPLNAIIDVINGSIDQNNLADNSVVAAKIASNAVTTVKINENAVTGPKLSTDAISIGYAEITSSVGPTASNTSDKDIAGLSVTVTVPAGGRDLKITGHLGGYTQTGGIGSIYAVLRILEGTTGLGASGLVPSAANLPDAINVFTRVSAPSAGSHTYKLAIDHNGTGPNYTVGASSIDPSFILVELI